MMLHIFPAVV